MKHPSSREFFAYWDEKRGAAQAPDRSEIEPGAVRELLGDIFVLSYDATSGHPFRVAGTRVCALAGRDLKDRSFSALFAPDARREIE
ncbi:MAG TPA: PAS domain-containing protein, partial [Bradyrhizobium sp.]|nr:PAS domain-containing protein [Bradyrhizobium sp.]